MVGDVNLKFIRALVKLAKDNDLIQLNVDGISITPRQALPKYDSASLPRNVAKVTDEELLFDPYSGLTGGFNG